MVLCNILLYRNGQLISWDSLPNDELHMIMDKVRDKFIISELHIDGRINVGPYKMYENMNIEFPLTEDIKGVLVGNCIARERYSMYNIKQSKETTYPPRYISFIPRNETPEGYYKPPAEPGDLTKLIYVYKDSATYIHDKTWIGNTIRLLLYEYLKRNYPKMKSDAWNVTIADDNVITMSQRLLEKIKGGTIMFCPKDERLRCSFYIK